MKVGLQKGDECVKECINRKLIDPTINGVTMKRDNSEGCWCEKSMSNIDTADTTYKSCYLLGRC